MRLETKRLVLREWKKDDVNDLVEGLNDLNVSKWLAFAPYPYTKRDAEDWIGYCNGLARRGKNRGGYEFAIELRSKRKVIGGVSLQRIDRSQGTAGGGIWINAKYQRQGYGTEAFGEKLRFAFVDLKLRRMDNGFFEGNTASFKLQMKFGFKVEGKRRGGLVSRADGKVKDECLTGLLKTEWKRRV
jgi:RimJ/RimL family protein N-acetyltransferase